MQAIPWFETGRGDVGWCSGGNSKRTFLPSGIALRSISTLAWARTSAEADMLTRKSVFDRYRQSSYRLKVYLKPRPAHLLRFQTYPKLTLDSSFRSHGRSRTHRPYQEILEHPIRHLIIAALVLRKTRHLGRLASGATTPLERVVKGGRIWRHLARTATGLLCCARGCGSREGERGGGRARGGESVPRPVAEEGCGGFCERGHCGVQEVDGAVTSCREVLGVVGREAATGWSREVGWRQSKTKLS